MSAITKSHVQGPRRTRVVVVGNGMVGHRFCEELAQADVDRRFRIACIGEEPRPAYDRVHLSEFFSGRTAEDLRIADPNWYALQGVGLRLGDRVVVIDRAAGAVETAAGARVPYDALVLATGSSPFVPSLPGIERPGVFVYRTIEDLEAIRAWGATARRAAVIGGGLLGLEAAKAVRDMGLETHVVEFAPRLMPRQVDAGGGEVLRQSIERLGVRVHVGAQTEAIDGDCDGTVTSLRLRDGISLAVDMVIVSAGIRPRDELAGAAGLALGERGGIVVDTTLATSDPRIFCIGEAALASGMIYGLVAPGYEMARVLAARLTGADARFTGADLSTTLKLLGVAVASFGDAFADETLGSAASRVVVEDRLRGVYQKLVVNESRRLLGGVLIGDADAYPTLVGILRSGRPLPERPHDLLVGATGDGAAVAVCDDDHVCSCNGVSRGAIRSAIRDQELSSVGAIKACTRAGTGCGGCVPALAVILDTELAAAGREVSRSVCEHFAYTRQELFEIVKLGRIDSFEQLLESHGRGGGCEVCRPVVASILATTWNDLILKHATIQDTNDRFLANIQRGGTYSVVPRIPGGEITPEKLIAIGEIARRFDLYCKITGGQRIDLLGARVEQLPDIWEALVAAGFESGHAYGKALRTVKSCIGSTWCRYGVQDSTALAIRVEERYRGLRAPHKLKSAVSGCIRECAEAQSKDFGIIATERGWNLYVCGNGGAQPRHADLLATDVDEATLIKLIDRFLMYYIHTANPLERTARWLERLEGGLDQLRAVVVDDALGIAAQLERDMERLVASYACEWAAVVRDPERRREFTTAGAAGPTNGDGFLRVRGQKHPEPWHADDVPLPAPVVDDTHDDWVRVADAADVPRDGGLTIAHGALRVAVFHFATRNEWWATQATCPHRQEVVLGRGLLGTQGDTPKVACPLHKRTFSLASGACLSDARYQLRTYPVEIRDGSVWLRLPPLRRRRRRSEYDERGARMRASVAVRPVRDAAIATALLLAAIWLGSRFGADLDPALYGYAAATVVAVFGLTWRASAFWRRPASAGYARALAGALRSPRLLRTALHSAGADLGGQTFIARRSRVRWVAHMSLSLGTLASFAITVPLVFGWLHFAAEGQTHYRPMLFGFPAGPALAVEGVLAWFVFHGLALAGVAVAFGAAYFLVTRLRTRTIPGVTNGRHLAPLVLLLLVALSGLALPASRTSPLAFAIASRAHELAVIVLLVAMPFSKLAHVLIRPLQLGARVQNRPDAERGICACGTPLAPTAQLAAVEALLAARGARFAGHQQHCPTCRRKLVAAAQARLLGAPFHPDLVAAGPDRPNRKVA